MKARHYLRGLAALGLAAVLAACGTAGPGSAGHPGDLTIWAITGGYNSVFGNSVKAYDSAHGTNSQLQLFQSDTYKQKIHVTLGTGNPPDVFENWGGSALSELAQQNLVVDLSDPALQARFLPSLLGSATFGGKLYGVPMNGISPAVVFYNKKIFTQYGLTPPKTFDELLATVGALKAKGVTPFALGGAQQWTELMFEEYLVDRVGGAEVVDNIVNQGKDAWSGPAVLRATTLVTQLIDAGAFADGFSAVSYDTGQASALLYTGKAGMELMGSWEFASIQKSDPDFIAANDLGWFTFPTVAGGAGDPSDLEGNPANYFSIPAKSHNTAAARSYLNDDVMSPNYVRDMIAAGRTPPVPGIADQLAHGQNADWNTFVYDLAQNAHHYTLSWDQALPADEATTMLTNISELFLGQLTPQQFSAAMDKAAE